MEEQLVRKETALLAGECGFNVDTIFGMDNYGQLNAKVSHSNDGSRISWDKRDSDLRMPSQSLLSKWLREEHGIHIWVLPGEMYVNYVGYLSKGIHLYVNYDTQTKPNENYEEVIEETIIMALELIKK